MRGRYTVLSGAIGVLVVVPRALLGGVSREILLKAMDEHGLPWDAPVKVHIVGEDGEDLYLRDAYILIADCKASKEIGAR